MWHQTMQSDRIGTDRGGANDAVSTLTISPVLEVSMAKKSLPHSPSVAQSKTPEYAAYRRARNRCLNPNAVGFKYYGGRGIEFRFTSFEQFLDAVGERPSSRHSLDRIDNEGHYEPGNVRWATPRMQVRNRRTSVYATLDGVSLSIGEWAELLNLSVKFIYSRLYKKWCDACALTLPLQGWCPHRPSKESCRKGHLWTPENTIHRTVQGRPGRKCRTCKREANRRYVKRKQQNDQRNAEIGE